MLDCNGDKYLLATRRFLANTFFSRFRGLMLQERLEENSAFILYPCSSAHMFFMKFPLDIVYTDEKLNVVKVEKNVKPWRVSLGHIKAKYTFEFPAGTIEMEPVKIIMD